MPGGRGMDLELLDELEGKVDACASTVQELRTQNGLLQEEVEGLEQKVSELSGALDEAGETRNRSDKLQVRCSELEKRLAQVRGRIGRMIDRMKALEE
jgi:FtsZ-binding cell division protein ZapB